MTNGVAETQTLTQLRDDAGENYEPSKPRIICTAEPETAAQIGGFLMGINPDHCKRVYSTQPLGVPVATLAAPERMFPDTPAEVARKYVQLGALIFQDKTQGKRFTLKQPELDKVRYDGNEVVVARFRQQKVRTRFSWLRESLIETAFESMQLPALEDWVDKTHLPDVVVPLYRPHSKTLNPISRTVRQQFDEDFPRRIQLRPRFFPPHIEDVPEEKISEADKDFIERLRQEDEDWESNLFERAVRAAQQHPTAEVIYYDDGTPIHGEEIVQMLGNLSVISSDVRFLTVRY